jgi:phage-related protein
MNSVLTGAQPAHLDAFIKFTTIRVYPAVLKSIYELESKEAKKRNCPVFTNDQLRHNTVQIPLFLDALDSHQGSTSQGGTTARF